MMVYGTQVYGRKMTYYLRKNEMPYVSEAQRAWMHKNKPKMAKRWEKKTGSKRLPKRAKKK